MKNLLQFIVFILSVSFIASCDVVEDPFPPNLDAGELPWDDSSFSEPNDGVRFVLMEEFTGHTCTNCPDAAKEVERLRKKKYGKKFIPIAMHATETFGAPKVVDGAPAGSYQSDHRTDESLDYENEPIFGDFALPKAMISRRGDEPKMQNVTRWVPYCDAIFNTDDSASVADINIKTYFHTPSSTFKVAVEIEWIEDYAGDMNLQIQVVEDSIIDWQLDNGAHIPDYVFDHMYRGAVNGSWGTPLEAAEAGSTTDTSFSREIELYLGKVRQFSLNNYEKTNFDDWHVVVYLYKDSPDYEVMQVNEASLTSAGKL